MYIIIFAEKKSLLPGNPCTNSTLLALVAFASIARGCRFAAGLALVWTSLHNKLAGTSLWLSGWHAVLLTLCAICPFATFTLLFTIPTRHISAMGASNPVLVAAFFTDTCRAVTAEEPRLPAPGRLPQPVKLR